MRAALRGVDMDAPSESELRVIVLAGFLDLLSEQHGLSEDYDKALSARAKQPTRFLPFLGHYLGVDFESLETEVLRTRLYATLDELVPATPDLAERGLGIAQVYWNLSWEEDDRPKLPLRHGPPVETTDNRGKPTRVVPLIWADWISSGRKNLGLELRSKRADAVAGGPIGTSGRGLIQSGARLAVLAARQLIETNIAQPPTLCCTLITTVDGGGTPKLCVVWQDDADSGGSEGGFNRTLEAAVEETANRAGRLRGLAIVTQRASALSPTTFLSGGSMTAAEVARYGVPRRIDFDGTILGVEEVADRICGEATVGFLPAGPGEGKSTYLHALTAVLVNRAITFTWNPGAAPDWAEVQRFRDKVASRASFASEEIPVVIVGELQRNPSREQEDLLIEVFQSVPSGLATSTTSLILAGRPAWLNRIRQRSPSGLTMRLMPLAEDEAGSLVENLAAAYVACGEARGEDWTQIQFPNLGEFLAMPMASRIAVFRRGPSLVGALLRAAYGSRFADRLRAEYNDLADADREAYLLVSLATSSLGGISEDLLMSICPAAAVEQCSAGTPWLRQHSDGLHRARHEMIGRLVVEDADAATRSEIGSIIRKVIGAAHADPEARDLLRSVVHVYDDPRSLIPWRQRKSESQFRDGIRAGITNDRTSWERFETSIGNAAGELLSFSYFLHRLLPGARPSDAEYLLERSERLLALAEAAASPGSPTAERSRYHRIITARERRRRRGDVVDDPNDVITLIPMMSHSWPEAILYAQVLSLGLSTLKNCDLDDDEEDEIAQAVLEAWQRLRLEGTTREQVYRYAPFVSRDLSEWPLDRRLSLWQTAWEFSRALATPDGALACLIDVELAKLQKNSGADLAKLARRRKDVLSLSVVPRPPTTVLLSTPLRL